MNTYEDMLDLQAKGLATVSQNGDLATFKYARKVMYDYLWKTDSRLLECRGSTYNVHTGELVVAAPRKSFNYLEDGWWSDKPLNTPVVAYKKYNGFLACVSRHGQSGLISTTGSTKSDFVKMAEEYIPAANWHWLTEDYTLLYEVVHPSDPHIVEEPFGAHFLGSRCKRTGVFSPHGKLEDVYIGTLKGILAIAEVNTGEGFIAYTLDDHSRLSPAKIKTPYYTGKKKLMRLSKKNSEIMYKQPADLISQLPEIWKFSVTKIMEKFTLEQWLQVEEQDRRKVLEDLIGYA